MIKHNKIDINNNNNNKLNKKLLKVKKLLKIINLTFNIRLFHINIRLNYIKLIIINISYYKL